MQNRVAGQQASIIDERPDSGQRHYRRADGKRPAAAIPARRRAWLARYPGNQGPGKIELDFTRLAINLSFTKKNLFTLKWKGWQIMRTNRILLSLAMAAFLLLAVTPGVAQGPYYAVGSVSIDMTSVAAGVGASWGGGVLRFKGKSYPFKIDGLSVGSVGVSSISAVGNVYNMTSVSQFSGNYAAVGAGITLAGGVAGLKMQNQGGVIINLYATQAGVQLNIGPQGFTITMR
jgi:hypothetical protein